MASIYVGNLAFDVTENELQAAFEEHGQVSSVNIIKDRETGGRADFAFVEMPDGQEAKQAIEALNLIADQRPEHHRQRGSPQGKSLGGGGGGGRGRRW